MKKAYMCTYLITNKDINNTKLEEFDLNQSIELTEVSRDYQVIISKYDNIWVDNKTNKKIKYNCIDIDKPIEIVQDDNEYIDNTLNNTMVKYCWGFSTDETNEEKFEHAKIKFKDKFMKIISDKMFPSLLEKYENMYFKKYFSKC